MPELPDITVYVEALRKRIVGQPIEEIRLSTPFLLRTVEPPLADLVGKRVIGVERLGKRIAIATEDDLFIVLHLMIAGRLHWKARGTKGGRKGLADIEFPNGCLTLTEAGTKRRASLYVVRGRANLEPHTRAAASRCSTPRSTNSRRVFGRRATRSSAHSPTRVSSAESATRIRMRSSTARGFRR